MADVSETGLSQRIRMKKKKFDRLKYLQSVPDISKARKPWTGIPRQRMEITPIEDMSKHGADGNGQPHHN